VGYQVGSNKNDIFSYFFDILSLDILDFDIKSRHPKEQGKEGTTGMPILQACEACSETRFCDCRRIVFSN
jgi:hypothetical protein